MVSNQYLVELGYKEQIKTQLDLRLKLSLLFHRMKAN